MGKRLLNLHTWQWRSYADNRRQLPNLSLYLMTVPFFILAVLLILDGVFSLSLSSLAIGMIGLIAALGIHMKPNNPSP
ncbi:hypothetical protein [Pseudomonas viridiflava]|uniref:hypothetical protein n=1 Tax=Pseudomonas viridiflava TaxID=33069 RepID=UPI0019682D04|nr:hypothetical protein [Pseudomonas viridiflava]